MEPQLCVQIHQYNDYEILELFNTGHVEYRLLGDHLFAISSRGRDVAAGPGDWLTLGAGGEVEVKRGDYAQRTKQALHGARRRRAIRSNAARANPGRPALRQTA